MCVCVALLGNEERSKNFLDNLAEDEHGNVIGVKDIEAIKQEQGESVMEKNVETADCEQQQEQQNVEKKQVVQ